MLRHQHLQPVPNVLFSSRRRARRPRYGPSSGQTRLPDWVWGAGLGLIVVIAVGGYFLLSSGGGSAGQCDKALGTLGTVSINQAEFNDVDVSFGHIIDMLNAGDRTGAEQAFSGPVHNLSHNAEPRLREVDVEAAKTLCNEVYNVEELISSRAPVSEMARSMALIREYLRDAAETLGFARPGEVMEIEPPTPDEQQGVQYVWAT